MATAAQEAKAAAIWMSAHGYETGLWHFHTALNCYGPTSSRTEYAAGYAVTYKGTLIRDNGTRAEYPSKGIQVWCQPGQLPLGKLIQAGRALVTFGNGGGRDYGPYAAYYVAGWNPRESDVQRDPEINPGILPTVNLHELTPMIGGDGPLRFYDMRLNPAGAWLPGDRVVIISGQYRGETGIVQTGQSLTTGTPTVSIEMDNGRWRLVEPDAADWFALPATAYVYSAAGELTDAIMCPDEAAWQAVIAGYPWHGAGTPRVLAREPEPRPEGGWPLT
jgi:hypothetical protein